jgi:Protein of unknown function with HXXEE motif
MTRVEGSGGPASASDDARRRHAGAWTWLVAALALHVVDEALTGFLGFYNPLVRSIRSEYPWFPMPTFAFGPWLIGLGVLVVTLSCLIPVVRRGGAGIRAASWALSAIMFLNGLGHLAGSAYFDRWLPGTTSAPLLLLTSVLLARAAKEAGRLRDV